MKRSDIQAKEFHPYYNQYINSTPDIAFDQVLIQSQDKVIEFLNSIPIEKLEYRYEEDKWTIKEIIQHIIDTERIFAYRALRIARHDTTPISGYEHNDYVPASKANRLSLKELLDDYRSVRHCTLSLYNSMDYEMLQQIGNANGNNMSARAAFCILVGHEKHHCRIISEKYL